MKLEKPYGIILLVLIALIILAILFPPFAYKKGGEYFEHYFLFEYLHGLCAPRWDWVLAEIIVLVLLAAGAAVTVKTFEKKPKKENNHEH